MHGAKVCRRKEKRFLLGFCLRVNTNTTYLNNLRPFKSTTSVQKSGAVVAVA